MLDDAVNVLSGEPEPTEPTANPSPGEPALIAQPGSEPLSVEFHAARAPSDEFQHLPIFRVVPSLTNTRACFEGEEFEAFVRDIETRGVIEPIIVRPVKVSAEHHARLDDAAFDFPQEWPEIGSEAFEIVGGERRWRASLEAGNDTIPARILALTDDEAYEGQLVENLQRADLSAVEEARGYEQWLRRFQALRPEFSRKDLIEVLAVRVGKKTRTVYERLQVLRLEPEALAAVEAGKIEASAATVLQRAEPAAQRAIAQQAQAGEKLTVAALKERVAKKPAAMPEADAAAAQAKAVERTKLAAQDARVYFAIMLRVVDYDLIALDALIEEFLGAAELGIDGITAMCRWFRFPLPFDSADPVGHVRRQYRLHSGGMTPAEKLGFLLSCLIAEAIGDDDSLALHFRRSDLDRLARRYEVDPAAIRSGKVSVLPTPAKFAPANKPAAKKAAKAKPKAKRPKPLPIKAAKKTKPAKKAAKGGRK